MTKHFDPFFYESLSVTLATGTPHSRTFALVEQSELNSASVGDDTHLSAEGVYLTHDLTFGYTTNGRIATHLCNLVHVHRDEQCLTTHTGSRTGCLASCVTGSNYYDVVFKIHISVLLLSCSMFIGTTPFIKARIYRFHRGLKGILYMTSVGYFQCFGMNQDTYNIKP